jgi:hypothetical protein
MNNLHDAIEAVVLVQWKDETAARDVLALVGEAPAPRAVSRPAAIAAEVKARAAYLRSRPMASSQGLQRQEAEILADLDGLEVRAQMAEVQRKGGHDGPEYLDELAVIERLAFAARQHFAGLLAALGEPHPTRSKQLDPAQRARELAEIERFLAAKKARATGTDGK